MTLGVIMLVHTGLDRAAQVVRHVAAAGCPVVIHCDRAVPAAEYARFRARLADLPDICFVTRRRCEWGTWGIVGATLDAAAEMLKRFAQVDHVYLASGACLPLRPLPELKAYLAAHEGRDFIESVTIDAAGWAKGGLEGERFTLRFPFAWRRRRWLFDRWVALQRRLRWHRAPPAGLVPHLGSQWWCLSRGTLGAILLDPRLPEFVRYFRRVWIPDESFFQSLVRLHSVTIESRSLTLSRFDDRGRPHLFYDDHLEMLARSDCFMARKAWPGAGALYDGFLGGAARARQQAPPCPGRINRVFGAATERRMRGRAGLYMQSRFPVWQPPNRQTCAPYAVFQGFRELFPGFEDWLADVSGDCVHGRLYHPRGAGFAGGAPVFAGALAATPALRDYNPCAFLTNLLWNTRGTRQAFMFHPADTQFPWGFLVGDPHARINVISGAWALGLFRRGPGCAAARRAEAARLQAIERGQLAALNGSWAKAAVRVWSLAEFIEAPQANLAGILADPGRPSGALAPPPLRPVDLTGFGDFLQALRNDGLHLHLAGQFPPGDGAAARRQATIARPRPLAATG